MLQIIFISNVTFWRLDRDPGRFQFVQERLRIFVLGTRPRQEDKMLGTSFGHPFGSALTKATQASGNDVAAIRFKVEARLSVKGNLANY